jgi:hypothetical protein
MNRPKANAPLKKRQNAHKRRAIAGRRQTTRRTTMQVDAQEVIDRLARQIGELAVRLAVAEARVAAYELAATEDATDEGL